MEAWAQVFSDTATFPIRHQSRGAHTARHTLCADLQLFNIKVSKLLLVAAERNSSPRFNSLVIYSPQCHSKPICCYFLSTTKKGRIQRISLQYMVVKFQKLNFLSIF